MEYFNNIHFVIRSSFLDCLLLLPLLLLWHWRGKFKKKVSLKISTDEGFKNYQPTLRQKIGFTL